MSTTATIPPTLPVSLPYRPVGIVRARLRSAAHMLPIVVTAGILEPHEAVRQIVGLAAQGHGSTVEPVRAALVRILAQLSDEPATT